MSMIIGKRQIILAALVVALGTAIFLNAKFSGLGSTDATAVFNTSSALGDSTYVSASGAASGTASTKSAASSSKSKSSASSKTTASASSSLFAQERLKRTQTRADAEDKLKIVLNSTSATDADKEAAQTQLSTMADNINTENVIESLVIAKGFSDCVCFLNNGSATVVVSPKSGQQLSASESAQITDIVIKQAKIDASALSIIQSK